VVRRVGFRNLVYEEALPHWEPLRQKQSCADRKPDSDLIFKKYAQKKHVPVLMLF